MKARLYKGPFSGKVIEHDGSRDIVVTGPRRMTRKQRYEFEREQASRIQYIGYPMRPQLPQVQALYRVCTKPVPNVIGIALQDDDIGPALAPGYAVMQLVHPDGSVFYEFVSKKEYS